MNWETIKFIYRNVLIYKYKIEYLGENKYKIIRCDKNGKISGTIEYKNNKVHGETMFYDKNGTKYWNGIYVNGVCEISDST